MVFIKQHLWSSKTAFLLKSPRVIYVSKYKELHKKLKQESMTLYARMGLVHTRCGQRALSPWEDEPTNSLQWRHDGRDGVSNHQPHHCLLNRLFRHRSKKTSKLPTTGLCAGNSPVTGEFPTQLASRAANVSIWWRHHLQTHQCVADLSTYLEWVYFKRL